MVKIENHLMTRLHESLLAPYYIEFVIFLQVLNIYFIQLDFR